jgi:hypothetical protein
MQLQVVLLSSDVDVAVARALEVDLMPIVSNMQLTK